MYSSSNGRGPSSRVGPLSVEFQLQHRREGGDAAVRVFDRRNTIRYKGFRLRAGAFTEGLCVFASSRISPFVVLSP